MIVNKGSIYIENNEDFTNAFHVMCNCGHEAYEHGYYIPGYGSVIPCTANISQCVMCNCSRFDPKEKLENARISSS